MEACSEKGCVSLATRGDKCAVHGAGYQKHDGAGELRCGHCRRLISKDEWYQRTGDSLRHVRNCPEHKDTAMARLKREAAQTTT